MNETFVISGPTACGKTSLSVELAKQTDSEIVSCDVMQSYRDLDIGTAKITETEKNGIVHYMINEYDITENVTVADFSQQAIKYIEQIHLKRKSAILVGGSGLYVDAIVYENYIFDEQTNDVALNAELEVFYKEQGKQALYAILKTLDEKYAEKVHPNNVKRVIRAIINIKNSGIKQSERNDSPLKERFYPTFYFYLDMPRDKLYQRINFRVDTMVENGLFEESHKIYLQSGEKRTNAFEAIGYKECFQYFKGNITKEEAIEEIKKNTRHYAKRQITWFLRNPQIIRIDTNTYPTAELQTERILEIKNAF